MSHLFFKYHPGRLDAHFRHGAFDSIVLRLRMHGASQVITSCNEQLKPFKSDHFTSPRRDFSIYMTSIFCPFDEFIRFLEAMVVQVQECAFEWDAEGPEGRISWKRRLPDQDGFLTVSWDGWYGDHVQKFSYRTMLNTRQAVNMLYTAFRRFVESDAYEPIRYEVLRFGEVFEPILENDSLKELGECLSNLDSNDAEVLLQQLYDVVSMRYCGTAIKRHSLDYYLSRREIYEHQTLQDSKWIPDDWTNWGPDERRKVIFESIFASQLTLSFGKNLRRLRSPLIEQWLARPSASKYAG